MKKTTKKETAVKKPVKKQVKKETKPNWQQNPSEKMDTVIYGLNIEKKPLMAKITVSFEAIGNFFKRLGQKIGF